MQDENQPTPSKPLSLMARRILGEAMLDAGKEHKEAQMVMAGMRLLERAKKPKT